MTTVAFIGLGHMGSPMAHNLLKKGITLKVYDLHAPAMQLLEQSGAQITHSLQEVVQNSAVIITMVQTGEQVKQCCLGEQGIFAHIQRDALYIDCSSIDVKTSQELHQIATQQKIAMLDAPVSGGVAAATAGSLTFMVGGETTHFMQAQSILSAMGKNVIHAGAAGSGVAAKICNNMLLGISMIGVSEAFVLADQLGLAAEKLFEICAHASGQCWSLTQYCPWPNILPNVPSSHQYQAGFTAAMMLKDLRLSQDAAAFAGIDTPLGKQASQLYQQFVDAGHAELDFSAILTALQPV